MLLRLDIHASLFDVFLALAPLGIGVGSSLALFLVVIQNAVPQQKIGQATAAALFFRGSRCGRLRMHLLWFDTLLGRTTTVSEQDKERTRLQMSEYESLLDYSPFVRDRVAKAETREAQALAKGLQEALVVAVELRFPALLDLAQERAKRVKEPGALRFALKALKTAPSEETARFVLETLAA